MSALESFCGGCGYPLTREGDGWSGCKCAKLAELHQRGANVLVLDEEVTRLRAALSEIAALQTEEPVNPLTEDIGPRDVWADMDDCFEGAMSYGMRFARHEAAEMARKGLGS